MLTGRSYAEISMSIYKIMQILLGEQEVTRYLIKSDKVESIIGKEIQIVDDYSYKRKFGNE